MYDVTHTALDTALCTSVSKWEVIESTKAVRGDLMKRRTTYAVRLVLGLV